MPTFHSTFHPTCLLCNMLCSFDMLRLQHIFRRDYLRQTTRLLKSLHCFVLFTPKQLVFFPEMASSMKRRIVAAILIHEFNLMIINNNAKKVNTLTDLVLLIQYH